MYKFNVEKCYEEIIKWTREWFEKNGNDKKAIIGMSGGKDSTITAALLVKSLGKERVIGVMMPDINQGLNDADKICEWLGIKCMKVDLAEITTAFNPYILTGDVDLQWSKQTLQNIPPRIRMTMLYAIAQTYNGFVSNNCNLCEDYIGYSTKWGDAAGDFSLLAKLTVDEIKQLGDYMGIPKEWVHKTPDDGLPFSSPDEEKFGFSYHILSDYIRGIAQPEQEIRDKILKMHQVNLHKLEIAHAIPTYKPGWYTLND